MDKNFIFRIGPFECDGCPEYFYYVYPGREDDFLFIVGSDKEGFERILEVYLSDELECEPEIAEIAAQYKIRAGAISSERAHNIALMGLEAIEEQHFKDIKREGLIYQFGGAGADFWHSQSWNQAFSKFHLQFTFSGSINATLYGIVMGANTTNYGVALYRTSEDLKEMLDTAREGFLNDAGTIDTLGVILQDQPHYAVHAMQRSHGIDRVPIPVKIQDRTRCLITDSDLLILAASLEAVSVMNDTMEFSIGRVSVEDLTITCHVAPVRSPACSP